MAGPLLGGIDCGARFVKAVLVAEGRIAWRAVAPSGYEGGEAAARLFDGLCAEAGVAPGAVAALGVTGSWRGDLGRGASAVTPVTAAARGARLLAGDQAAVIEVGAEETRALRCGPGGKVLDFAENEKCAGGAGIFVETMARILDAPVEEMGALSLAGGGALRIDSLCAIFAESEVVGLVHRGERREEIARAVHEALARRVAALARRVGAGGTPLFVGGVALDAGMVAALGRALGREVKVPDAPQLCGAAGAAVAAGERRGGAG